MSDSGRVIGESNPHHPNYLKQRDFAICGHFPRCDGAHLTKDCPLTAPVTAQREVPVAFVPPLTAPPPPVSSSSEKPDPPDFTIVTFLYRNHRGEVARRRVYPVALWFGCTAWHTGHGQWFLKAFDLDKQGQRDFAVSGLLGPWLPVKKLD